MNKLKQTVILFCVLLSCSCSLLGKPTDVNYLIPKGFTGGVIILYNQPDGITPETTKDGAIIYRIPKDGFLKVKQPFKRSYHKLNYYFVDAADKQTPIEYLQPEYYVRDRGDTTTKSHDSITEDERNNQVFVMNHRNVTFDLNGNKAVINGFIIGNPKDVTSLYVDMDRRIDKIDKDLSRN